jgi:putative membrane protein
MLDKLNKKTGADFDQLYIDDQVSAHDEAIELFKDYAQNGDDAKVKQFATQTLPVLLKHKQDITQVQKDYTGAK